MIPGTAVIPGPGRSVTLSSGVAGTSQNKWTLVGKNLQQTFVGRARVLHAVDIVDLAVASGPFLKTNFVDPVFDVVRHGSIRTVEYGGLVHVIPESRNAIGNQRL